MTNGTAGGTVELKRDFAPINNYGIRFSSLLPTLGNITSLTSRQVLFSGLTGSAATDLFVTDGTLAGTRQIGSFGPTSTSSMSASTSLSGFSSLGNGRAVFNVRSNASSPGFWTTDGTAAGTTRLSAGTRTVVSVSGGTALTTASNGNNGTLLGITDGTLGETATLRDFVSIWGTSGTLGSFQALGNGQTVFSLAAGGTGGNQLWVTDGTAAGTSLVAQQAVTTTDPNGLDPTVATRIATGRALFAANNGTVARSRSALWTTDGTTAGTALVADLPTAAGRLGYISSIIPLANGKALACLDTYRTNSHPACSGVAGGHLCQQQWPLAQQPAHRLSPAALARCRARRPWRSCAPPHLGGGHPARVARPAARRRHLVEGSRRWRAVEDQLIPRALFAAMREPGPLPMAIPLIAKAYPADRRALLERRMAEVEAKAVAQQLEDVWIKGGELTVTPLKAVTSEAAEDLGGRLYAMLPNARVTDVLAEVDRWTGLSAACTHLHTGLPGADPRVVLTAILADVTNLGLTWMADACALASYHQLAWAAGWHLREETYKAALAAVVNAQQQQHPLAALFGAPDVSSSDGQHFHTAAQGEALGSHNARHGAEPSVLFDTHHSARHAPFHILAIPPAGEAAYVVDGLFYHEADLSIAVHQTDGGGVSDCNFALMHLLGVCYASRIPNLADRRFYAFDPASTWPTLAPSSRAGPDRS